jgi:hypothetical protein
MASVSLTASGISFADYQTPAGGMTSELLDHYEEGAWTATQSFGSGSAAIATSAVSYSRVGGIVSITGYFSVGAPSSPSGNWNVAGLPFSLSSGKQSYFYITIWNQLGASTGSSFFAQYSGGTTFPIWLASAGTGRGTPAGPYANSSDGPIVGLDFSYPAY